MLDNLVNGIYKIHPDGPIIQAKFNYDDYTIGPYKIEFPYKHNIELASTLRDVSNTMLYSEMVNNHDAVAVFSTSNSLLITVLPTDIVVYGIYGDIREVYPVSDLRIQHTEVVGVMKTFCPCKTVPINPARLIYKDGKILDGKGNWHTSPHIPDIPDELSLRLYRKLTESNYDFLITTKDGVKGGNF